MKYLTSFLLFLVFVNCQKKENKPEFIKAEIIPSKIDSLNSEKEVQAFVKKLKHPFYQQKISEDSVIVYRKFEEFELKKISEFNRNCEYDEDILTKQIAASLKINKSFYKSDFDNNGYTDLLIIGDSHNCASPKGCENCDECEGPEKLKYISCDFSVYSLMNFGNDSINSIDLNFITQSLSLVPKIIDTELGSFIELHKPQEYNYENRKLEIVNKTIPLIYKYGTFIERNTKNKEHEIENIEFIADGCVAGCSEFIISIDSNRNGKFNALNYNWFDKDFSSDLEPNDIDGEFKTIVSTEHFNEIYGIINYLDFPNLDNSYYSGAMHSSSVALKITFDGGKIKTIKDNGLIGTYGLNRVYEMFYELRFNQEWK
ncbi:hypothetical protein HNV08_05425 [Winogradskyella eckloniae]|uniref:DUF6438 domain-containing protein n=1 Tax=Winogradskyella eckloniae TaxID=1089306 RepID=UPI0015636B4F|nr:DUF6438 domain-containing protein [Winogradskyella eckloniae]NRD19479.1 hypothetical protein [Winogradskyella eckloniae]